MATIHWDGGGGDFNWDNAENWIEDVVPGPADLAQRWRHDVVNQSDDAQAVVGELGDDRPHLGFVAVDERSKDVSLVMGEFHEEDVALDEAVPAGEVRAAAISKRRGRA